MEYQTFLVDPLQYPVEKLKENGGSMGNREATDFGGGNNILIKFLCRLSLWETRGVTVH